MTLHKSQTVKSSTSVFVVVIAHFFSGSAYIEVPQDSNGLKSLPFSSFRFGATHCLVLRTLMESIQWETSGMLKFLSNGRFETKTLV